jgi:hypothetical protein
VKEMMNNKYTNFIIDIMGKLMLAWFLFTTIRYFYSGMFIDEINKISQLFSHGEIVWLVYIVSQVIIATVGIIVLIPLLMKGHIGGLVLGILYWIMGNYTNPLWFIVPHKMQIDLSGKAINTLLAINIIYSVVTLSVTVAFYFYRRSIKLKT